MLLLLVVPTIRKEIQEELKVNYDVFIQNPTFMLKNLILFLHIINDVSSAALYV